jgi:flagellar basal body-associated protein FliL
MGDAAEQKAAEEHLEEGGGGKSKLPFIVAGLAVFLIIVLAIAYMVMKGGGGETLIVEPTKEPPGYTLKFENPFSTNLAPPDDQYIYSVDVTLELKHKTDYTQAEMLAEIGVDSDSREIRMPAILDAITGVIASKTRLEVSSVGGRDTMRREIMNKVNEVIEKGEVTKVYLSGYSVN